MSENDDTWIIVAQVLIAIDLRVILGMQDMSDCS